MLSKARGKYVRVSPYKLRPIVDHLRGLKLDRAIAFLKTYSVKRVKPILKIVESAYANAKDINANINSMDDIFIKEIRVDNGPVITYFKPGAMGRACIQRKRLSHIEVVLDSKADIMKNKIEN